MATVGWVDTADAASYLALKVGAEAWATLSNGDQTKYLTTAYRKLYSDMRFDWPSSPSQKMKDAQTEYAWTLYETGGQYSQTESLKNEGISSFSIGNFSAAFEAGKADRFNRQGGFGYGPLADDLIRPYFSLPQMSAYAKRDDSYTGDSSVTVDKDDITLLNGTD